MPNTQEVRESTQVPVDALRWRCDENTIAFLTTQEVSCVGDVQGQSTAREALRFGIECLAPGQNVYVRGARGTGRILMVRQLLDELQPTTESLRDYCYVHNFARRDHPRLVTLPAGDGPKFRRVMLELAEFAELELLKALEGEPFSSNRHEVQESTQQQIKSLMRPLEQELQSNGLALIQQEQGPGQAGIYPLLEGKPVPFEQLHAMAAQGAIENIDVNKLEDLAHGYQKQLKDIGREINDLIRKASVKIREINETGTRELMASRIEHARKEFPTDAVNAFLDEVLDDIVEYRIDNEEDPPLKDLYGVNVVLTQDGSNARPVIEESTPSPMNLLGVVEPEFGPGGMPISDYRGIRAGALLRADQGYLVLDVNDLVSEPGSWRALMRTLRTGRLEIVPPEVGWMRQSVVTQPEPIPIQVRVILIGDVGTYYQLDHADPDFRELFKVLSDFDNELPRTSDAINTYACVLSALGNDEGLGPFHKSAVAALAEHGARIVSRPDRLTARFGRIADLAREAAFLAGAEGPVMREHVIESIARTKKRASLPSRKFQEMVSRGTIRVETSGEAVGQVNGLAVMHSGPLTYGFPARITATIGPGTAGLINIEGRANMSGTIHTKGFHILGGLLRHLLRTQHPMAFSASIAFEQSYGGIDGDSASGVEMVCLLSALTGVPVKQSMAMTGAIDQRGHIQAIGGVNEKIEGFFDACSSSGLTGDQGVIVPQSNVGELMLREDVVEACREGKFSVHGVETIHQALSLMTGQDVGESDAEGKYPTESLLGKAVAKAGQFWKMTLSSPAQLTQVETAPEGNPMIPPPKAETRDDGETA